MATPAATISPAIALQRPESRIEAPYQGLAPRRGAHLSIRTDLSTRDEQLSSDPGNVQRNDTLVYRTTLNDPAALAPYETNVVSRRASKIGLKGLFRKGSALKPPSYETRLTFNSEESKPSNKITSNTPFFQPKDAAKDAAKAVSSKLQTAKPRQASHAPVPSITWDPPPLFQAPPQSIKMGTVLAPVLPADTVLRIDKERREADEKTDTGVAAGVDSDLESESKKSQKQAAGTIECASKTFVLTTTGFMLQYSSEGNHDRLPERIMQLSKDSAAFASDAIPGKHWVLQVSQTACEEGPVVNEARKSMFPRFGLGGGIKRPVRNYLMVMSSAEEMDSWMTALRREIQQLGGKTYQSDESRPQGNASQILQPRLRPHRSTMGLVTTGQTQHGQPPIGPSPSHEGFNPNFPHPAKLRRDTPDRHPRLSRRASSYAILQSPDNTTALQGLPSINAPNTDKALPSPPSLSSITSPVSGGASGVNALGICMSPKGFGFAIPSQTVNNKPLSPALPSPARRRSMLPISAYHRLESPKERKLSESSMDSKRGMNFSIPSFSRQHPLTERTSEDGNTISSRGRTPSLTDDGSTRPGSIIGDLPNSTRSIQRPTFPASVETAVAMPMSPVRAETVDNKLPEIVFVPPELRPAIPRRMSSLDYNGHLPISDVEKSIYQIKSTTYSPRLTSLPVEARIASPTTNNFSGTMPASDLHDPTSESSSAFTTTQATLQTEPAPVVTLSSPAQRQQVIRASPPHESPRPSSRASIKSPPNDSLDQQALKPRPLTIKGKKLPRAAPMTIQERRKFLGKNNLTQFPPAPPPPTASLPPPPGAPPSCPLPAVPGSEPKQDSSGTSVVKLLPIKAPRASVLLSREPLTPPTRYTPDLNTSQRDDDHSSKFDHVATEVNDLLLSTRKFDPRAPSQYLPASPPQSTVPSQGNSPQIDVGEELGVKPSVGADHAEEKTWERLGREHATTTITIAADPQDSVAQEDTETKSSSNDSIPRLEPNGSLQAEKTELTLDLPRSPVSESWATYLQRVGVS